MKHNGIELEEMLPENWDGKSRNMFVWSDGDKPLKQIVCGYDPVHSVWVAVETQAVWRHCAEIPKEAQDTKHSINNCIDTIESIIDCFSADWQDLYRDVITYLESLTELKEENEKLKAECIARRKSEEEFKWERDQYRDERDEFANLLGKKKDGIVGESVDKEEPTSEIAEIKDAITEKTRRMTNHELAEWLAKGNGQYKNRNFGSFRTELVYCPSEENTTVDNDCLIRGFNEDTWHEPIIKE